MSVNWYPGHMVRAKKEITENLKLVDVVAEIVDARAPQSTRNPDLEDLCRGKPLLLVLNRKDLVNPEDARDWTQRFRKSGFEAVAVNSLTGKDMGNVMQSLERLYRPAAQAMVAKGRRIRPPRVMVVGIPNVGKSTFLNAALKRKAARTGPEPGVTRGKQWVRVEGKVDFLDTPGLMWPRIEEKEQGLKLAALGLIGEKAYNVLEVAAFLINLLNEKAPGALGKSLNWDLIEDDPEGVLLELARRNGWMTGDEPDTVKSALHILTRFRKGQIARMVLDD